MKKLSILIATRNRQRKLMDTLLSIPYEDYVRVVLIFDGDPENYDFFKSMKCKGSKAEIVCHLVSHRGSVAARNFGIQYTQGDVFYATDDIIFQPNHLIEAYEFFKEKFPDGDGVTGIAQDKDHNKAGIGILGRRFIERFPEKLVFCPYYYHFVIDELRRHAEAINRFSYFEKQKFQHKHPAFYPNLVDQTHHDARIHREKDLHLVDLRTRLGFSWGLNG